LTILRHRGKGPYRDGCGFVLLTFLFSCFFLLLNSALISRLVPAPETAPGLLARQGVNQAVLFVGPVILIFVEWWLVDLVVALVTRGRSVDSLPPDRKTPQRP
jgi:hypothetical protein